MVNKVVYRDPTPNNFPNDYDPAKVDPRVKLRSDSIKDKQKGIDTREAMYQALEIGSVTASEAKSTADKTAESQDSLNQRVDDQIAAGTIKDEEIDFRHSEMLKKTFETMRKRGDFYDDELLNRGINPKWFGAVGDGVSDDTEALQSTIDYLATIGGGVLYLPAGKFSYTNILINSPHIKLTGPGTLLNGQLNIGDNQIRRLFVEIDGITFGMEDLSDESKAIVGQNAHDVIIRNAQFNNYGSAVYIAPIKTTHAQHCAAWKIHHCNFSNVNYALNIDRDPEFTGDGYTTGDFGFTDNYVRANIYHVYAKGIDGFIFDRNVCFFPNNKESSQIKVSNVYIRMGHYINIANSSLFEAGDWAVQLFECGEVNVHHNNIAWPGQLVQAGGVMMAWGAQNKTSTVESIISNNIIDSPSGIGVVAQDGVDNLIISNNRVLNFGSQDYYYGTNPLGTAYAVAVAGTAKNNYVTGNMATGTGNWINSGAVQNNVIDGNLFNGKRAPVLSVFTTKDNLNTLPVNYDVLNIANTANTTISHMGEGYEGQQLLIRVFDGRTTMISDGHQVLKSLTTRKLYVNEALLFRYSFGQWVEI